MPDKPFTENEKVTVSTDRTIVGATDGDYSFEIGDETRRTLRPVEAPDVGRGAVQSYATRKDLAPPAVTVSTNKPGTAPGLVFLAPKAGRGQDGPMIIDNRGHLVWFKPMQGKIAADFRVQTYQGKPVLTWWEGALFLGDGDGVGQVLDTNYKPVTTVRTGNGYTFDLHEFTITPRNTALVLAYERYNRSLKTFGGPADAKIVDNIVQEIDLATGLVLFEWHSFGNVSPEESNVPVPKEKGSEWEYFHANAVDLDADGNFLVSARNTSTVYKVNRATGKIMWRLGGKKSDFKLGPGMRFDWQHSIRAQPDGTYKLYDNSAAPPVRKASRVLTFKLDLQAKTATLISAYTHPRKLLSASQGNVERLPNGNEFVGWGSQRWFTEFSPTGQVLFDGHLARGNDNYRAFRYEWQASRPQPPKVIAERQEREHHRARQLERRDQRRPLGAAGGRRCRHARADRVGQPRGFETAVTAKSTAALVAMRAYDAAGNVLGTSAPVKPSSA